MQRRQANSRSALDELLTRAAPTTPQTAAILSPLARLKRKTSTAVSSVAFQAFISLLGGSMPSAARGDPENKRDDRLGRHFAGTQRALAPTSAGKGCS